ncbi:hypothetical protein [Sphingomonas leidyi]|uniref:hypothetical protein n=1 Tax=Sphingomonas leidyi TaxID=68569 RepID=UPI0036D41544
MTTKIDGYVPTTFKDAGTGETFEGGKTHKFEPGAHANYTAAGKIGEAPATEKAAEKVTEKGADKGADKGGTADKGATA